MAQTATPPLISGAEVRVDGRALDPAVAESIMEVRVDSHRTLPDAVCVRLADPRVTAVDGSTFAIGSEIEVLLAAPGAGALTSVFSGQVVALEAEFVAGECVLAARGYDRSHALNRSPRTATYQNMTYGDIAAKLAAGAGLSAGTIASGGPGQPRDFVQQSNETDWAFLWRLARSVDYEVAVAGTALHFRPAAGPPGGSPLPLAWGDGLLSFRPRVTGVQQVDRVVVRGWDPATQQAIEGTAQAPAPDGGIGADRAGAASALGGGTVTVVDHPVGSQAEAQAVAEGIAARMSNAFAEAEGVAIGDPRLRPGAQVRISGVGERFGGSYALSATSHVMDGRRGYLTHFAVSGRAARTLRELAAPGARPPWRNTVAVGVVTNNQDPDALGRVRVRHPTLGPDHEGWWARIAAPSAGANRGLLMLPVAGDEVLLAFEHGDDEHPYVLGSLWNGQAQPQALACEDGSLGLRSDQRITVEAAGPISIKGEQTVGIEAGGDLAVKAQGALDQQSQGDMTLQSGAGVAVKAATEAKVDAGTQLTLQSGTGAKLAGGAEVVLEAGGQLTIRAASIQIQASGIVQIAGAQILLG